MVWEAGRQRAKIVENWILHVAEFELISNVTQLYVKRGENGKITMLPAKLTDYILLDGALNDFQRFMEQLDKSFKLGKLVIDEPILFNGCRITKDDEGNTKIYM